MSHLPHQCYTSLSVHVQTKKMSKSPSYFTKFTFLSRVTSLRHEVSKYLNNFLVLSKLEALRQNSRQAL